MSRMTWMRLMGGWLEGKFMFSFEFFGGHGRGSIGVI